MVRKEKLNDEEEPDRDEDEDEEIERQLAEVEELTSSDEDEDEELCCICKQPVPFEPDEMRVEDDEGNVAHRTCLAASIVVDRFREKAEEAIEGAKATYSMISEIQLVRAQQAGCFMALVAFGLGLLLGYWIWG